MAEILDFSKELDVSLLDRVVLTFYTGSGDDQRTAQELMTRFQDHDEAWTKVDTILQNSKEQYTKFFAMQILEKFVQTRWNTLVPESQNVIRTFVNNFIGQVSATDESLAKEKSYVRKLNMVLVQILKQDWPGKWRGFIPEIVESSKSSLSMCENNMVILQLLSEEIFDFSADQLTQQKAANLKNQMRDEFSKIYELCKEVLDKVRKPSLIIATLKTLLRFVNWIPEEYVSNTNLIEVLLERFSDPNYRNSAGLSYHNAILRCLTEIGGLTSANIDPEKLQRLFLGTMTTVSEFIPPNTDLCEKYENGSDEEQDFLQNLALFLTSFLQVHIKIIEQLPSNELLIHAHYYLVKLSRIEDRELFKICLEYWAQLVQSLYDESMGNFQSAQVLGLTRPRKEMYLDVLSSLRVVIIERMVKPEEVLVVENDEGEIVREFVKESDTIVLYKSMKEVLVYLTHLDVNDTEGIMTKKLASQMDGSEWSWQNLNKLCWAVGSISGAMSEDYEKRFLVLVIKDLLTLCERKRGKDNKAVVASNIMYTVGQYPRFLKAHWKFLKTVVNKLFEFMHESHEGVQDMACDTFIKISEKCKMTFAVRQLGEEKPFVEEILELLSTHTSELVAQQIHTFYEAVGHMIAAPAESDPKMQLARQEKLLNSLMELPNAAWANVVGPARQGNLAALNSPDGIKMLVNVMKTNVSACTSVGSPFVLQLDLIYDDMLFIYEAVGRMISESINEQGDIAIKTPRVRGLRTIKRDILKLIDTYVRCTQEKDYVTNRMLPGFFMVVLTDYQQCKDIAREAEVLNVLSGIVDCLKGLLVTQIPAVLDATFQATLNLITNDFTEYPEHRTHFYAMLRSINKHCFGALLNLPEGSFKLIVDSVVWGFKHTMRDIADVSLQICGEMIDNFNQCDPSIAGAFYQSYFLSILQDIFFVLTDRDHKSGFKGQTEVLAKLFYVVRNNKIQVKLFDPSQVSDPNMSNEQFLDAHITQLLQNAFPHLQMAQIKVFVIALFEYNSDPAKLKLEVRDFLIQLKEFAGENTELYLEEKEKELEERKRLEREKALSIPGMIKPSELPVTMDEDVTL